MNAPLSPKLAAPSRSPWWSSQHSVLIGLLILQIAVFSRIGHNFATVGNAFEILRLSVEVGLLAVAITPVIITAGIDLSVGSLMGLCAVLFGVMVKDAHLPIPIACLLTCVAAALAGWLNGWLVTRLKIPPLIVTLATYSLFRGLAEGIEGMMQKADRLDEFPKSFLDLGNEYLFGRIPAQLPFLIVAIIVFWLLLHHTVIGRSWVAIGYSPDASRYSGIPVERRVRLAYLLSGTVAGIASIIYIARLGQAKADVGTNYELLAITAVVLGGTSIFGGQGSIPGTVLGLLAIAVLQNGLLLSDYQEEFARILVGLLLIGAISLNRFREFRAGRRTVSTVNPSAGNTSTVKTT